MGECQNDAGDRAAAGAWASIALIFATNPLVAMAYPAHSPADLPADTVLKVRFNDTIGSDRNHAGDRFTATVEDRLDQSVVLAD
jgi:hypothetical protein